MHSHVYMYVICICTRTSLCEDTRTQQMTVSICMKWNMYMPASHWHHVSQVNETKLTQQACMYWAPIILCRGSITQIIDLSMIYTTTYSIICHMWHAHARGGKQTYIDEHAAAISYGTSTSMSPLRICIRAHSEVVRCDVCVKRIPAARKLVPTHCHNVMFIVLSLYTIMHISIIYVL